MSHKKMGRLESRFADFIWDNEPILKRIIDGFRG